MKVLIDPGHYHNCPNRGHNGYNEGDGMYQLAVNLQADLIRHGIHCDLTRGNINGEMGLTTRGNMAKCYDLFISEHSNANDGKTRGVEVFYSIDLPQDVAFAKNLSKGISTLMGNPDRGAKFRESTVEKGEDYYTVIDSAQDIGCKHVILIENGFHDNLIDEAFLLNENNLLKLAREQAKWICQFLGIKYVPIN